MAWGSILEYVEAVRGRYFLASKKEKGKISGEFSKVTGCHRKAAIRLFHRPNLFQNGLRAGMLLS